MLTTAARPVAARFLLHRTNTNTFLRSMGTIADGVEFDTIAREWRCKVSKHKAEGWHKNELNAKSQLS